MSTRSYRARSAALARWHRAAYEAEKLATVNTSRPRHMLETAPAVSDNPFAVGDVVCWKGEDGEIRGLIVAFTESRAEVHSTYGGFSRFFPRINQLARVENK